MVNDSVHKFHIPVMGLAFTIDSPVKVARFGISSVISIIEDRLIETMRSYYYPIANKDYFPISMKEFDFRAKRITDYLNLVNTIVDEQIEKLKKSAFEKGSEIVKYFEMLPEDSLLKQAYHQFVNTANAIEKASLENILRSKIVPGSIDVNIMSKVDRSNYNEAGELVEDNSDAVAALRGYAKSDLENSSIIFSAGLNPQLYNYLEKCPQFDADENGNFKKKIAIKVSDYRSALIQGKYLAKKGIWVSEFRIESGLNCGGHAFASDGNLMGPILDEFRTKKDELTKAIFEVYNATLKARGKNGFEQPLPVKITAQGGIGTFEEDQFLHEYYHIESTGWGTPFLLVPEATTVDEKTLELLCQAKEKDILLSKNSPLGVPFHYLKGTSSDIEKQMRIKNGKPGSPCPEKLLAFNTEFTTEQICTGSLQYQKLKIQDLQSQNLPPAEYQRQYQEVVDKECLCIGLSNAAPVQYKETFINKYEAVTICPGPNIVNYSKVVPLQTMVDHIYGRVNLVDNDNRPNMFIAELRLYIKYLKDLLANDPNRATDHKKMKYYKEFHKNLMGGIEYYFQLPKEKIANYEVFTQDLNKAKEEMGELVIG